MTTKDIKRELREGPYAWPGGYPLYFVTDEGAPLSFEAVRQNWRYVCASVRGELRDGWRVKYLCINWENPELLCDHTGKFIESAYCS